VKNLWMLLALLVALTLVACTPEPEGDDDDTVAENPFVVFTDAELEACVRAEAGIEDEDILPEMVSGLIHLDCPDHGITNLEGLEEFNSLQALGMWENEIEDLTPLAGLGRLKWVQLGHNDIRDLTPLAGATDLLRLGLADNRISDLAPLTDLQELRWLELDNNEITAGDVENLCGLGSLTWVTLEHNYLGSSDASCLADEGVEVYLEYQDDEGDLADASTPPMTYPIDAAAPEGMLTLDVGAKGDVVLGWQRDAGRTDVIPEFGGSLVVEHGLIQHRTAGRSQTIGSMTANGWELCSGEYADVCELSIGHKTGGHHPDFAEPSLLVTANLQFFTPQFPADAMDEEDDEPGYAEVDEGLMDYVFASPNQFDAGSCLFMATTGAMEVLLNQHVDPDTIDYMGDTDLSERYLMNVYAQVPSSKMNYFLTDLIYTYNHFGGSLLDRDYPFEAGYVKDGWNGVTEAEPTDSGAYFSAYYSWLNHLPDTWEEMLVETPNAERTTVFVDPDRDSNSYWAVAVTDWESVDIIKYLLRTQRAPVIVVYNHYLYWHAVMVVGYDDTYKTGGCEFVESNLDYFSQQGATSYVNQIENAMDDLGGCREYGVFYVRDSIYDGTIEELEYTYSEEYNFTDKYSKRIVLRSYDWVTYLGNHAYTIHR